MVYIPNSKKSDKHLRIEIVVIIISLVIMIIVSGFQFFWRTQCTEPVKAVFVSYDKTARKSFLSFDAKYKYFYNNKMYVSESINHRFLKGDNQPGDVCVVYINPEHPYQMKDSDSLFDFNDLTMFILVPVIWKVINLQKAELKSRKRYKRK